MNITRIHHYTSVEALALILRSRKIRFSRVGKVDDVSEAERHPRFRWGNYVFVSCWTYDHAESIPQWHMYTGDMRGVRISMPVYPFQAKRLVPKPGWKGIESEGALFSPLAMDEILGDGYLVGSLFLNGIGLGGAIDYRDDIDKQFAEAITVEERAGRIAFQARRPLELVRMKGTEWAFQKEHRFALIAFPSAPMPDDGPGSKGFVGAVLDHMGTAMAQGAAPPIEYLDVDLSREALETLEVTLGPKCSPGTKIAVEAVVERFAPSARVSESKLTGMIR